MANATSKLEPFRDFIATERKKKTTYRQLAELLEAKGVQVDPSTIYAFVKVRSKPPRTVTTMWEPDAGNTSAAAVSLPQARPGTPRNPKTSGAQLDAIERLKNAKPTRRHSEKALSTFDPDAPLDRLDPKEAKRQRDRLKG